MEYQRYQAKKILNIQKHIDGGWFWTKYSAYPYLGCYFGCEYCYERDEKYLPYKGKPELFDKFVKIKENAPELLEKELKKVPVDLISIGDWQPAEAKFRLSRQMLEVCYKLGFPVFVLEKSPLILEDLDLLKKINKKSGVVASFSIITTKDDSTRRIFEPKAPSVLSRFLAMKKIAKAGILTGTSFMPILPFVYDNDENLENVVKETKRSGGSYVLAGGLTLWGNVKPYFFGIIKKYFPDLLPKYQELYSDDKKFGSYWIKITNKVKEYCRKYRLSDKIPRPIEYFPKNLQFNKKVAEKFYLKAKEIQETGGNPFREWAYRKAAWAIDDLDQSLVDIYERSWLVGIQKIEGIGNRLAHEIEKEIKRLS